MHDQATMRFTVLDTAVEVRPGIWLNLAALAAFLAWWRARRGQDARPWPSQLAVGILAALTAMSADVGHAFAHIVSARRAGAPMDAILLSHGMPRTLYHDEDVAPWQHRMRALGGPAFSLLGLLASALLRKSTPPDTLGHELAGYGVLGHGLIFAGSLAPVPYVDGGSILKWSLVEAGVDQGDADEAIRKIDLGLGVAATAAGAGLLAARRWLPGIGLLAGGAVALATALGKIR